MKVLITGFDPFGGESQNPAYDAVKLLPSEIAGAEVIKLEIPTVFGKVREVLEAAIIKHKPDVVISIGQAGGSFGIEVERVGINLADGRIADNEGVQPIDEIIFEDGDNAYFSNLPVKAMVKEIRDAGIPATLSYSAGSYVCNYVLYSILYLIKKKYSNIRGGFIHVPYAPSQATSKASNTPTMSVENISKGIEAAIRASITNDKDIKTAEGKIS
ncbi:MAG: pyroglutamyl-peptidase I [Clostridium sp.]|uniref:pyroglutamyl-peptidase I n=1 Tax=Clostridium sp. TaxID=1506 RepID=UPI0030408884